MTGTAAAGGLALINPIGNLGGFDGRYFMGWVKNATQRHGAIEPIAPCRCQCSGEPGLSE